MSSPFRNAPAQALRQPFLDGTGRGFPTSAGAFKNPADSPPETSNNSVATNNIVGHSEPPTLGTRTRHGGPLFDFGRGSWRRAYVVENDGIVEEHALHLQLVLSTEEPAWPPQYASVLPPFLLCVGRVYLEGCNPPYLTGFFVSPEIFITVAAFIPSLPGTTTPVTDIAGLQNPQNPKAFISQARVNKNCVSDVNAKAAVLVAYLAQEDLAIFRTVGGHTAKHHVHITDLYPSASKPPTFGKKRIVIAGYNGDLEVTGEDRAGKTFDEHVKGCLQSLPPTLTYRFEQALVQDPRHCFETLFSPHQRSMTLGRIVDLEQDPTSINSNNRTWPVAVSGWNGLAGGPVIMLERSAVACIAKVIGWFQGGEPGEAVNRMRPFTEDLIEVIKRHIDAGPTSPLGMPVGGQW